jgi:hypothetical protein
MPLGCRSVIFVAPTGFSPSRDGSSLSALRASSFPWTRAQLATDATKHRHLQLLREPRAFALAGSALSLIAGRRADDEPGSVTAFLRSVRLANVPGNDISKARC